MLEHLPLLVVHVGVLFEIRAVHELVIHVEDFACHRLNRYHRYRFLPFLPLPVPAGVYGLFLLLGALCAGAVRVKDVEETGNFLLETMPLMFIPVTVGLVENLEQVKQIAVPLLAISVVSTVVVLFATGKTADWLIRRGRRNGHE